MSADEVAHSRECFDRMSAPLYESEVAFVGTWMQNEDRSWQSWCDAASRSRMGGSLA